MFIFFCLSKRHRIISKNLTWNCAHHLFTVLTKCKVQSFNYDPLSLWVNLRYSLYSELLYKVIHLELRACFWSYMPICQENFTLIDGISYPIAKCFCVCLSCFRCPEKGSISFPSKFAVNWCHTMDCWYQGKAGPVNYFDVGIFLHICCNALYQKNLLE